jgi:NhaP-type Na+/H+ or K+/H+ antiporter
MFNAPGAVTHVWHMFEFIGNTLIFVLAGPSSAPTSLWDYFGWMGVGWLLVLYVLMNVIRGLMVLLFYPALKVMGYGLGWRVAIVPSYGGLRGAVGLSLALIISLGNWNGKGGAAFPTQVVFPTRLVNGSRGN